MLRRLLPFVVALAIFGQQQVRVLTYNIHHGEGTDAKIDLDRIAKVIISADPDLVAVQEVDVANTRSSKVDQAHELAGRTGLHVLFGRTIDYRGGWYGNALLSRWPAGGFTNHDMPFTPGRERRGVIEAAVLPAPTVKNGAMFLFLATHLDTTEPDRLLAVKRIHEIVLERPEGWPMILAGDLNATPDSATMKALFEDWTSAALSEPLLTYPSANPTRQIDFVLFRPAARWRVIEVKAVEEPVASDHRPVLAVLELSPEAQPAQSFSRKR